MNDEAPDIRLRRLGMRSMRRGTREMDIVLGRFAEANLAQMEPEALDLYEALLDENDNDLYRWVSGQEPAPERFAELISVISQHVTQSAQILN